MRFWILLSFLLTPMASSALAADQCPVADGWYRRWANCDAHLRTLDVSAQQRTRAIVAAHTVESGSAVTWEEEDFELARETLDHATLEGTDDAHLGLALLFLLRAKLNVQRGLADEDSAAMARTHLDDASDARPETALYRAASLDGPWARDDR